MDLDIDSSSFSSDDFLDLDAEMELEEQLGMAEEEARRCRVSGRAARRSFMPRHCAALRLVWVSGYSAPITAGNFVDLVQRGFYNGLPLDLETKRLPASVTDSGVAVCTGDPSALGGEVTGFVDPLAAAAVFFGSRTKECVIALIFRFT